MLRENDVISTSPSQVSTNLGTQAVILELDTSTYYGTDEVGAAIWEFVKTPRSVAEIIEYVVSEYDVDPDRARAEVLPFVERLLEKRLLSLQSVSPAVPTVNDDRNEA